MNKSKMKLSGVSFFQNTYSFSLLYLNWLSNNNNQHHCQGTSLSGMMMMMMMMMMMIVFYSLGGGPPNEGSSDLQGKLTLCFI